MEDGKPKVWTVATVEVLSTCDACGGTELIDMQIGLTKKEGLKEALLDLQYLIMIIILLGN